MDDELGKLIKELMVLVKKISVEDSDKISKEIPAFDSIIEHSIQQLPNLIQPSIKRGIPVRSQFKLPILVSVEY